MVLAVENATQGGTNAFQSVYDCAFTTSGVDRVVLLEISFNSGIASQTVLTVTDTTGLTWQRRAQYQRGFDAGGGYLTVETWWAHAPSAVTGIHATVTLSGNANTCNIHSFAVSGCNSPTSPWDPNVSIPKFNSDISGASNTPTVSGVSTTDTDTLLIGVCSLVANGVTQVEASGYTLILSSNMEPGAGSQRTNTLTEYKLVSSAQSGISVVTGNTTGYWTVLADAITQGVAPNVWASIETPDTFAASGYPGGFGQLGYIAAVETRDSFAAVGYQPVTGILTSFGAADGFSAYGFQPLTAIWASTERPDTFAGTGIGRGEDGVMLTSEAADIFAALGTTPISGSFTTSEAPDRFSAIGSGVIRVRRRRSFFAT